MFSADCYLSVISAFLSVMLAELSTGEEVERGKREGEEERGGRRLDGNQAYHKQEM